MDIRLEALERRLAAAERRARRMFAMGGAFFMAGGALFAYASGGVASTRALASPSTIRAPFRVVDEHGGTLLEVKIDRNGAQRVPKLIVFDATGKAEVEANAVPGYGWLSVSNHGRVGVWVGGNEDGGMLAVLNRAGAKVVGITTSNRGGWLSVSDAHGRPSADLLSIVGGQLSIHSPDGKMAASLANDSSGGRLDLHRGGGVPALWAYGDHTGGHVQLYDPHGQPLPVRQ